MHMHDSATLCWEFKICTYQACTMGFSKMCHFTQKIKEKKTIVEWGMCEFSSLPPQKLNILMKARCVYIFYWKMFIAIPFYLHFFLKLMQTHLFIFADLWIQSSFFKKLSRLNRLLYFVATSRMLWGWFFKNATFFYMAHFLNYCWLHWPCCVCLCSKLSLEVIGC
jgi:hypothetical protein